MIYDVLIIGGGAIGCTIARFLSAYELKIALLEKNIEVCQETTKANSAIVHAGYDCEPGSLKAKLNVKGNSMFPALSRELDFRFETIGSMVLAFDVDDEKILEDLYQKGIKNQVPNIEIISGDRAREIEPKISPNVIAALHAKTAGVVDPFNYTYAMVENAILNGVSLFTETKVVNIEKTNDLFDVITTNKTFQTKFVVNAAGLYSDTIAKLVGDNDFRLLPTKGVYRLLDKTKEDFIHKVLFQTPSKIGKGILVTATYDGNTMLGPTAEKIDFVEDTTTKSISLQKIDSAAKKSVPSLDLSKTIRVFTGVRAKPDTGDFMIYPSRNMEGVVHCAGIESPGLASAPAIAEYVIEILNTIGLSLQKKTDFQPNRNGIRRITDMTMAEKVEAIENNPKYGKIICRCETVSEAEIVQAIHSPAGAKTVDGVKRRVRAGMGRCQGGFCGPRVLEILSRELQVDPTEIQKDLSGSQIIEQVVKKEKDKHASI